MFFQAEDGIRDVERSRGLGDVYKRQLFIECEVGSYGSSCRENCSVNCKIPKTCNRETGRCTNGCQPGWDGITCKTSKYLKYVVTYIVC